MLLPRRATGARPPGGSNSKNASPQARPDVLQHRNFPTRRAWAIQRHVCGVWMLGMGTATTSRPSMPMKSFGLHVYTGNPLAHAVAAELVTQPPRRSSETAESAYSRHGRSREERWL